MDTRQIEQRFIANLQTFAGSNYAFDSGHKLREPKEGQKKSTQQEAFDSYLQGFREEHRHGYFEIPTGVGKTALFISLIKNYLDAANGTPDAPRVLIAVPSTDLVVQTAKAFAKFMPEIAPTIETEDDEGKEIDWEKSDIGLQYGKMKHAGRKPKVLITTYHSLTQDEENKIYPPKDFGFVIYDEGHNITASKFGQAVDKFKESIQLAVTATPEYSKSKTVEQKLPYCYYTLPLKEAINRGDLCQVRPVLIETGYTIDEEKAEQLFEQNKGKSLSAPQIEQLLNQEARNLAAIKTYLLAEDPETKERYFGQTGMVFGGGTQHCDDLVRQFNKVLNEPEYQPFKRLLAEEGKVLAVPIHSRIPKDGVELTIDGEKRKYSKDEIKALHRQGKILLLVSDKELKEGTDFPHDSMVIEMVDRLSVVDATQRFGRGFRLDPPVPEEGYPGNDQKICTAINLVDKNTYALYKDRPHMLPIYSAEILEGAEFRTPGTSEPHLLRRFRRRIPEINETIAQLSFNVVTDIGRVREVSRTYRQRRNDLLMEPLPDNKQHWLTGYEGCKRLSINANQENYRKLEQALQALLTEGKISFKTAGGQEILPASDCIGFYRKRSSYETAWHFDPAIADVVSGKMGVLPFLPEDKKHWVTGTAGCSALQINHSATNQTQMNQALETMLAENTIPFMDKTGVKVISRPADQYIGRYRTGAGTTGLYFDPTIALQVEERMGLIPALPKDKEHWAVITTGCSLLQISASPENKEKIEQVLGALLAEGSVRVVNEDSGKITVEPAAQHIARYRNHNHISLYFDPAIKEHVAERMGIIPALPEEKLHWVAGTSACRLLRTDNIPETLEQLNKTLESLLKEDAIPVVGQSGNETNMEPAKQYIGWYRRQGSAGLYFDPAIATYVGERMGLIPILPEDKQHWLPGYLVCKKIRISSSPENLKRLDKTLGILLAEGKVRVRNQDIGETGMEPADQHIQRYRQGGARGAAYYIDPAITEYVGERMGLAAILPEEKQHWLIGQEGLAQMKLGNSPDNLTQLNQVLETLMSAGEVSVPGQAGRESSLLPANECIGRYRSTIGKPGLYFDPVISSTIRELILEQRVLEQQAGNKQKRGRPIQPRPNLAQQTAEERAAEKGKATRNKA